MNNHISLPELIIYDIWPKLEAHEPPDHVPENVGHFYLQGVDNLARRNYDAAGAMFRKSLETALKAVHEDNSRTLYQRIESLPADLGVTPAMKRWAHAIRQLGADAAHEDDPFEAQGAKDIKLFAEVFLTQLFTLPAMIPDDAKKGGN